MKVTEPGRRTRSVLFLTAVLIALVPAPVRAGELADGFDFWVGEWKIAQRILGADGEWIELPAQTSVAPALEGRALVERWSGQVLFFWEGMEEPEPMTGLSVRAWDADEGVWRIHWMDSRSPRFGPPYVGGFTGGRGEFFRDVETPRGTRRDRITFSGIERNSVDWELAVSRDDGETWTPIWTMAMRRKR